MKLDYKTKNKILLAGSALGLILIWLLALGPTIELIKVNNELKDNSSADFAFNPVLKEKEISRLQNILKSYKVNDSEWSNSLWMNVSAIAIKQNIDLEYFRSTPPQESDSAKYKTETISFYSDYIKLVKLLDTMENLKKVGRISSVQINAPNSELTGARANQCILKVEWRGLPISDK